MCREDTIMKCIEGLHDFVNAVKDREVNEISVKMAEGCLKTIAREVERYDQYAIYATQQEASRFRRAAKIARMRNEARKKRKATLKRAALQPEIFKLP